MKDFDALASAHDYETCGGPLHCDYCGAILSESGDEMVARISAENRLRRLRSAAARGELRVGIHFEEDPMTNNDYSPPDPYQSLAEIRAAEDLTRAPLEEQWEARGLRDLAEMRAELDAEGPLLPRLRAAELEDAEPPKPYQLALDRARKER